jgi:hypothetical protein
MCLITRLRLWQTRISKGEHGRGYCALVTVLVLAGNIHSPGLIDGNGSV